MSVGPSPVARPSGRIRIAHLLGWTAGCALGLAAYRSAHPPYNPRFRVLGDAYDLVMSAAFGTFLAGSAVMAARRCRGERAGDDPPPGRWLLAFGLAAAAANGLALAAYVGAMALVYQIPPDQGAFLAIFRMSWAPQSFHPIHQTAGWSFGSLAAVAFALGLRGRLRGPWPVVFAAFATIGLILACGSTWTLIGFYAGGTTRPLVLWGWWARHVYAAGLVACTLVLLATLAWDHAHRRRTDGLHWAGALAWLGVAAIQLVAYVAFRR